MNRVLYLLIGGGVAAMAALAFVQQYIPKLSSADGLAGVGFCAVLAAAACTLIYSRRGKRIRLRLDQKEMDQDDRARMNARTKGEVRPPLGP